MYTQQVLPLDLLPRRGLIIHFHFDLPRAERARYQAKGYLKTSPERRPKSEYLQTSLMIHSVASTCRYI